MSGTAPAGIGRTVAAVIIDWEATAPPAASSSTPLRRRLESLSAVGVDIAVVSAADAPSVDSRLGARPRGPGRLWLCTGSGSERYDVSAGGLQLIRRRRTTRAEQAALDTAAARCVVALARHGLRPRLLPTTPTRRRIELFPGRPEPLRTTPATELADATARLRARGLDDLRSVLAVAGTAATTAGLADPRVTTDGRILELGLTDRSDSAHEVLDVLERRGIGSGLVLVVGRDPATLTTAADSPVTAGRSRRAITVPVTERLPPGHPGPSAPVGLSGTRLLLRLLNEQLRRRRTRRTPDVDHDPQWTITETGVDPLRHRITETLFTLGAGGLGTRGAVEEDGTGSLPLVLHAGLYTGNGATEHLLPCPLWTSLDIEPAPDDDVRSLDLRTGMLVRTEHGGRAMPLRTARFVSAARPGVVALRAEGTVGSLRAGAALRAPGGGAMGTGRHGERSWAREGADGAAGVVAMADQHTGRVGPLRTVERIAAYVAGHDRPPRLDDAAEALDAAVELGFDRLLDEHRAAWAARWNDVDVRIPDDPAAQLAVRYALFQLWCNVDRHDELAVGARGLSGSGYSGHVFWDADVFVLPALTSIDPRAAAAMVRYRLHRLDAARRRAAAEGRAGARFPWESAHTGHDVTPVAGSLGGTHVQILTGVQEEHVTADVAWAAAHHATWTGRWAPEARRDLPLLIETARYWASRVRADASGAMHIEGVIGPDEYHESVDDNAFTNVMARWNLRAAAALAERAGLHGDQPRRWRELAERIVDGYDPASGRYEQFRGYFDLEPLLIADIAPPPVAADLLIGRDRVAGSQLIKQPDVLMLHHLVPDELVPGSLLPDIDFYEPRTAHGSSLSPAVTAAVLARAGRADQALELFRLAATLDVGDTTGMTASGLHLANLGGLWQAVVGGFAGVSVSDAAMVVDPHLPTSWHRLEVRFRCLGRRVRLSIEADGAAAEVTIHVDGPLRVRLAGQPVHTVSRTARLGPAATRSGGRSPGRPPVGGRLRSVESRSVRSGPIVPSGQEEPR